MISVALASVRGHIVRFLMTTIAVALGVAFVVGTVLFSDSLNKTFSDLVAGTSKGIDVIVRGNVDSTQEGLQTQKTLPLSFGESLKTTDGVKNARPVLQGVATLVGNNGTAVRRGGAPTFGFWLTDNDPVVSIIDGRVPGGPNELAVEDTTLKLSGLSLGGQADVLVNGQRIPFTIVGTADSGISAGAAIIYFDQQRATELFAPTGEVAEFYMTAQDGVTQQQLVDQVTPVLPEGFEAITGQAYQDEANEQIKKGLNFITVFLLVFAAVSLVVGSFLIINTFLMLLAQRTRELAMLRAIGAKRRQLIVMVLVEALAIGVLGSIVGLGLGIGLAKLTVALLTTGLGMEMSSQLPIGTKAVTNAFAVGVGVTLLAAVFPAIRSSRVAPVAAMGAETAAARQPLVRRAVIAIALLAVAAVAAFLGLRDNAGDSRNMFIIAACVAAFASAVSGSAVLVKPVIGVLSLNAKAWGSVPGLAQENTVRNPRRTALTATALMIGLALVTGIGVLVTSATASTVKQVEETVRADFIISAGFEGMSSGVVDQVTQADTGTQALPLYLAPIVTTDDKQIVATAFDPSGLGRDLELQTLSGDLETLKANTIAISDNFSKDQSLAVGDSFTGRVGVADEREFTVGAVFKKTDVVGAMILDAAIYTDDVIEPQRRVGAILVSAADGEDPAVLKQSLTDQVKPLVTVNVQTRQEYLESATGSLQRLLAIVYGLLGLSIVIATLGIMNTLGMSMYERTREIGVLRAIGLKRRQLVAMVTLESVWTAVFGACVGVLLGLVLGVIGQRYLRDQGLTDLGIPWSTIVAVLVVAIVVGVIASLLPAFRAVRIKILDAIASL